MILKDMIDVTLERAHATSAVTQLEDASGFTSVFKFYFQKAVLSRSPMMPEDFFVPSEYEFRRSSQVFSSKKLSKF